MTRSPNFSALDAAGLVSEPQRTFLLALIGNLSFVWSNNESLFVHLIESLVGCDQASAVIIFTSLNSTRSRIETVERLGRAKIQDTALRKDLEYLLKEFGECTRIRNEFVHCMFGLDELGTLSFTQSFRIRDVAGTQSLEPPKPIDAARVAKLTTSIHRMRRFNRKVFEIIPRLRSETSLSAREKRAPLSP